MRVVPHVGLAAVVLAAGCGGGGGGDGPTVPVPTPAIALSLSATSASAVQGGTTTVTGTLTRSGGYTGSVTFTLEGVPTGVTGAVDIAQTNGATTTATISIQVALGAPVGSSTIVVRAAGNGVDPKSQSLQFTVLEAPDFSIAVLPVSASMVQGTSRNDIAVSLTRTNFPEAVTLGLAGQVPTGVTASFSPVAPTANSAMMTLTVGATAPIGNYNLEIVGTGAPGTRSAPFLLTITPAGSIALGVSPAGVVTLVQGGSASNKTINITRTNYSGGITLSAENLPAGVTASFAPHPVSGTSSVLTLSATAVASIGGPITVTIRGTGPDVLDATTTLSLSVKAPGSFTVAVSPPGAVSLFPGTSDNSKTVTVTRNDYSAPVTLSAENQGGGPLPAGLTASFAPNPAGAPSSVLTLTASNSLAPATYNLTIRGTGPLARTTGAATLVEATANLAVTVTALGTFTIGVTPSCPTGLTLSQGEMDDSRVIDITRTNFPPGITLAAEGLPPGVTATFAPNPATGANTRLSLTAATGAMVGTHNLVIRASGPAGVEATQPLALVVDAGSEDLDDLDYPFNGSLEHWLPGVSCPSAATGNWGAVAWEGPGVAHFDGVGAIGTPNAWISKQARLPAGANTLQFDAAGIGFVGADARLQVRIVDGGVSTVIFDQVITGVPGGLSFSTHSADIRPWAGRTVRIFFEHDANGTAHEHIYLDNIRILAALAGGWQYRKPLTIVTGAAAAPAGYSMAIQFDHAALVSAGKSLPSGDDVRIIYSNGTVAWELDRRRERGSSWNSANTRIWFATQAPIGANQNNGQYYLYYGNPAAGAPPTNRLRVFLFEDDFEGGTLSRWTITSNGLWVADNARAHDGAYSVRYPAEGDKGTAMLPNLSVNEPDVYVESWWYLDSPSTSYKTSLQVRHQPNQNYFQANLYESGTGWGVARFINPTFTQVVTTPAAAPVGTWFRVGTGIYGSTMRVFINGTEVVVANGLTQLGAGTVGLGKFHVPVGASWWADDFVARRYVYPEPTNSLGGEQPGPFAAGAWIGRKPGAPD